MRTLLIGLLGIGLLLVFYFTGCVVVQQDQQVVITRFGEFIRTMNEPGLYLKVPFIDDVHTFPKRLLRYDSHQKDVITGDKKTARIDNYARWRIVNPRRFIQSVGTVEAAMRRLDDIIYSELRVEIGRYNLTQIVTSAREQIISNVTQRSNEKTIGNLGIEVLDVRIVRVELPPENASAVYERMKSERSRQATKYRSEGGEQSAMIRAEAEKERTLILAEAYRQSQIIRGEGDAESIKIYNDALSQDTEFYAFTRTLQAYRKTLGNQTRLVLSPDSDFLRYLKGH
jgi:modulator of FtsH protease HflC